ncbi:hypothetical protein WM40_25590 [Robbsia andropogonis]|uniref:Immunity protein 52 domain-containing protein n=1 Tax=Robbsia andropogonis TaxID=28092 RepID=A0A0F5JTQ7_9BURK|nr:immunity 52 family protein [Robbsia andropogonis]KKB61029.1 hypothetical protein WM40_25590 [Robbsia andropogonis]
MDITAQYRDSKNIPHSEFGIHFARLHKVLSQLAGKDSKYSRWYLQTDTESQAHLYEVYDKAGAMTPAALAVLKEEYRKDFDESKRVGIWNGISDKLFCATVTLGMDNSVLPNSIDIRVGSAKGIPETFSSSVDFAAIVAAVATTYLPSYITVAPRKYITRQVFDDKLGVGWMLYLPRIITAKEVPEARELIPVLDFEKVQIGTIIVSVTEGVFSVDDPVHVEIANRIEIRLVDRDMLPRYQDL